MSELKIKLNAQQIDFLIKMLEIDDASDAIQKFAEIMAEERVSPKEMSKVINTIISKVKKK